MVLMTISITMTPSIISLFADIATILMFIDFLIKK